MISFSEFYHKLSAFGGKKWVLIGAGFAAGLAVHIYYVQEILAGLVLFSLLFAAVYVIVLCFFLLVRASKVVMAWAAPYAGRVRQWCIDSAERALASPIWNRAPRQRLPGEPRKLQMKSPRVRLRLAGFKPGHVYGAGVRAGVAVRTMGVSVGKRVSSRLGPWLTERVALSPSTLRRTPTRLFVRMRGAVSPHWKVFATRPPKNYSN